MNGKTIKCLRAMVWKEWRQHAKSAMLAAAGLSLAVLSQVTETHGAFYYVLKDFTQFWKSLGAVMVIGPMLIAVGIAFLQVFSEKRRDQWAFLIHRPISRSILFFGKALGGLSLYFAAAAVPLLIVAVWAAIPGDFGAPFDIRLFAAPFRSIALGSLAYFGALTTALRPTRWCGSRLLPMVFAMLCVFGIPQILSALFIPVLALAAWGAFAADGEDMRQPTAGKVALGFTLYASFAAIILVAVSYFDVVDRSSRPFDYAPTKVEHYVIAPNHIVQSNYVRSPGPGLSIGYDMVSVRGLDGRNYYDPKLLGSAGTSSYPMDLDTRYGLAWRDQLPNVTPLEIYPEIKRPPLDWFYVHSQRWIEVYSRGARRLIGRFGPSGYRPVSLGEPDRFPEGAVVLPNLIYLTLPDIYAFRHQIYRLAAFDANGRFLPIEQRKFTLLFQAPPGTEIENVTQASQYDDTASLAYFVKTNHGVQVLGGDGSVLAMLPWGAQSQENTSVDVNIVPHVDKSAANPDLYFFWFCSNEQTQSARTVVVVEVMGDGRIVQGVEMTDPVYQKASDTPWFGLAAPPPAIPLAVHLISRRDGHSAGVKLTAISLATALVCAVLGWGVGARMAVDRRIRDQCAVACFFLGLPCLLTLIALRSWPPRVRCHACGKKRFMRHEKCEHCGALFPERMRDGTEIFASPTLAMHTEAA